MGICRRSTLQITVAKLQLVLCNYKVVEIEWASCVQEVAQAPRPMGPDALLKQKIKQKRFREGYEDGMSSLHKEASAAAFIASDNPVEMLGQYTR